MNIDAFARRFWSMTAKRENGCIECVSRSLSHNGYPKVYFGGHQHAASRVAWIMKNGPIPAGVQVCHRCDNPPCVNLDHLFLGTQRENSLDMVSKGRCKAAKLTLRDVLDIRTINDSGHYSHRQIGKMFGIWHTQVGRIVRREQWIDATVAQR
jgi:uncharacterized protein YceK